MKPKVIKTTSEHTLALKRIEQLMEAKVGSPQEAELELWSLLVEKFEEKHFPIEAPNPVEAIRFRMEQQGLSRQDLTRYLQTKSKVSEILNRRRPLSLSMIRSLHYGLKIPAEVLVREDPTPYLAKRIAKIRE